MFTDIELMFQKEFGETFVSKKKRKRFHIKSLVHPESYEKKAEKRKGKFIGLFSKLKNNVSDLIGNIDSRQEAFEESRKEGIALAVLAMRGQLLGNLKQDELESAYKEGNESGLIAVGFSGENSIDQDVVLELREEFRDDVDRFIEDIANKLDSVIDTFEKKKGFNWTLAALLAALFAGLNSMEYRLRLISKEQYRRAYRKGMIDGILKTMEDKDLLIEKWRWETLGDNPCPRCLAIDGKEVTIEEAEKFLHPNCKCGLSFLYYEKV